MLNEISKVVKSYIRARSGEDFHSGQASHIVKLLKQFFSERDEQKEESGFTFGHKFLIAFTVKVSRCAINEIMKNVRHFQRRIIHSLKFGSEKMISSDCSRTRIRTLLKSIRQLTGSLRTLLNGFILLSHKNGTTHCECGSHG